MIKRLRPISDFIASVKVGKQMDLIDAINSLSKYKSHAAKFDESVDVCFRLGIDPKKSDQIVNGFCILPHSNGKKMDILAITNDVNGAISAGAKFAGHLDIIADLSSGKLVPQRDFNVCVASADVMSSLVKVAKLLGTKGLMPSPKNGTVVSDIATIIKSINGGRVQFKNDSSASIKMSIGKLSFDVAHIKANILALYTSLCGVKPAAVKDKYFIQLTLSSTMMNYAIPVKISSLSNNG